MRKLELTKNSFAIVDDEDYDGLNQWKWHCLNGKYAARSVWDSKTKSKKMVLMHTEIMKPKLGKLIDHKNQDGLDNRKENLRLADKATNGMNRGLPSNNVSGYKGVYWYKGGRKWMVKVDAIYLGIFSDIKEAARAYNKKAKELYGEFAFMNVV